MVGFVMQNLKELLHDMGACPRLEFDNIMFINCLGYGFHIYGAFEFLRNNIANL